MLLSARTEGSLSISPIAQNQRMGRWRTEAMRSHLSPRLLYVAKGHGRITIAGLTSGYGPNNLIFIPGKTMYGFDVGPTVFGQLLTIPAAMSPEWPAEAVHLRLRDVGAQKDLMILLDAIERELAADQTSGTRAAHYHLGLLSVFFERQMEQASGTDDRGDSASARLVAAYTDLVEQEFRSPKGVAELASQLGVTPTHLTRCCNQTCDRSAHDLLANRKYYEACFMLRETKLPVSTIAEQLGYGSAAYFSRAFQAKAGRSPSSFRGAGAP